MGERPSERFTDTLCREVLDAEWFATTCQARLVMDTWLEHYTEIRPSEMLGMPPPVPGTVWRKRRSVTRTKGTLQLDVSRYRALADLMYAGGELDKALDASGFLEFTYANRAEGIGCGTGAS